MSPQSNGKCHIHNLYQCKSSGSKVLKQTTSKKSPSTNRSRKSPSRNHSRKSPSTKKSPSKAVSRTTSTSKPNPKSPRSTPAKPAKTTKAKTAENEIPMDTLSEIINGTGTFSRIDTGFRALAYSRHQNYELTNVSANSLHIICYKRRKDWEVEMWYSPGVAGARDYARLTKLPSAAPYREQNHLASNFITENEGHLLIPVGVYWVTDRGDFGGHFNLLVIEKHDRFSNMGEVPWYLFDPHMEEHDEDLLPYKSIRECISKEFKLNIKITNDISRKLWGTGLQTDVDDIYCQSWVLMFCHTFQSVLLEDEGEPKFESLLEKVITNMSHGKPMNNLKAFLVDFYNNAYLEATSRSTKKRYTIKQLLTDPALRLAYKFYAGEEDIF